MADYNREWERTKAYLIRSLFHSVPQTGLSTISEESTQLSTDRNQETSTDVSYSPSESLDSNPNPATPISRQAVTADDSQEHERSPLPPLIIEREPNKHDEPEEYYDKLLIKMKKICKKLYVEGRSMSDDDFFIDINNGVDINISEQNDVSNIGHNNTFGIEEDMNNIRHEPDNNVHDINQGVSNTNKTYDINNKGKSDSLRDDLVMEDSTNTDSGDPQFIHQTVHALVNTPNETFSEDIPNINRESHANKTSLTQHSPAEDLSSPSRNLRCHSTLSPLFRESLEDIVSAECGTPPIKIEEISLSRISFTKERSQSPILICPYMPIKRKKIGINSLTSQDSEDSQSPQYIEMTIQAEVHVDADFHFQDTRFRTEQEIDSSYVQHLTSGEQINPITTNPCDSTGHSFTHTKSTNLTTSNINSSTSKGDYAILEEIQDPNPSSSSISNEVLTTDEHIEEMRSNQPQTCVHSDQIYDASTSSNVNISFGHNSQAVLQDVTNARSQDGSMNNHSNRNKRKKSFEHTDYSNNNLRGRKRKHENSLRKSDNDLNTSTSSNHVNENETGHFKDLQNRTPTTESSSTNADISQIIQMTVQAMVHVDANFHSQDTLLIEPNFEPQDEARTQIPQSPDSTQPNPNIQRLSQSMHQDMAHADSEVQTQRRTSSLNSQVNSTVLQSEQRLLPVLERRSATLQNNSQINEFENILDQTIPHDYRISSSHIETSSSSQDLRSDSQISEGGQYCRSPILISQYYTNKGTKKNVDLLDSENSDCRKSKRTFEMIENPDPNTDANKEPETGSRSATVQPNPLTLHQASTPGSLFKETLEQTLERMCGISSRQNPLQSPQNVSPDIETPSRKRSRSPIIMSIIPQKQSRQSVNSTSLSNTKAGFLQQSSNDSEESDCDAIMKSFSPSERLSDEEDVSISTGDEEQESTSSSSEEQTHSSDIHPEEMRSSRPRASIESIRIDDINFTKDLVNLSFLYNTPAIPQDITSHSQNNTHNDYANSNRNSSYSNNSSTNPKSRKRCYDKIACQNKKIDWDTLGNIFAGEPKLFKLCSNEEHYYM